MADDNGERLVKLNDVAAVGGGEAADTLNLELLDGSHLAKDGES